MLTTGPLEPAETEKGILAGAAEFIGPAVLEKQVVLCCSRDPGAEEPQFCSRLAEKHRRRSYAELYAAHWQAYDAYFRRFDIRIEETYLVKANFSPLDFVCTHIENLLQEKERQGEDA